jgi:hypothetical protein
MTHPLRSMGIAPLRRYWQSAPHRRIGTFSLTVGAACAFSLGIAGQVLTSIPEDGSAPGFDIT